MSEINVNKIAPSTGTNVTLGDASDTFKVPSGVTLDVESGATLDVTGATVSGLTSTTINNNADNRVITGSGTANTLNGETNLTFDGGTLTVKDDGSGATTETLVVTNGTSANPSYSNLVFKTAGNTSGCWIRGVQASGGNDGRLEFHVNNAGTVTQAMKMTYEGKVLINTTSTLGNTQGALHVKGTSNNNIARFGAGTNGEAIIFVNESNTAVGAIAVNASATAFETSSDYRLKENVDYTWDATTRLKELKPARFNWIVDKTNTLIDGFIAHEVSSVVPEAISGEKDAEEMQGIDQSKLVPLLTKALQEAMTKIETLEARVTTLEG